jgi:hypothetical protein
MPRLLVIVSIFCCLLTGCIQGDLHMTVNRDGSGSYQWKILTDPQAKAYVRQLAAFYKSKGYQISMINEKGKTGLIAYKGVTNIAKQSIREEINQTLPSQLLLPQQNQAVTTNASPSTQKELTIEPSWKTILRYETNISLQHQIKKFAGSYSDFVNRLIQKQTFGFSLTLPIAPTIHNATHTSKDGKTLTWQLNFVKSNPIIIGAEFPTPLILIVAATSGLIDYIPNFWLWSSIWAGVLIILLAILFFSLRFFYQRVKIRA